MQMRASHFFSDILEMTYTNGICLNGIRMEGNIMHMSVRTWWVNHYEEHGKVKKSGDCIDVTFRRNVEKTGKHLDFVHHIRFPVRVVAAALTRYGRKNVLIVAVNIIWKRKLGHRADAFDPVNRKVVIMEAYNEFKSASVF